jgi:Uroporphyrinogen decarboxylase (URO-D)
MAETIAPQQILRDLLQGNATPRPLFVPIVFKLGARVENLPPRAFLSNPTKISNALRQIHGPLRSDGVSCYFDPLLEAEALGGTLEWTSENESPVLRWSPATERGQLPVGLASPEDAIKEGRIPVALEVIRRLKMLLRDESLLMVGVTGPLTLAARLTVLLGPEAPTHEDLPESTLDVASSMILQVSKTLAEAGANLVFLREEISPTLGEQGAADWASMLAPIFNVIRFYEAVPVLQIADERAFQGNNGVAARLAADCIVCPTLEAVRNRSAEVCGQIQGARLGVGLSTQNVDRDDERLGEVIRDLRPALVTTSDDVPPTTDLKRLAAISEVVRQC